MNTKIPALIFLLLFALLIVSADSGHMPHVIRMLYDFPNGDRVWHIVLYGIWGFLFARAFPRSLPVGKHSIPISVLVLWLLAAAEECSQSLFPTRTFDLVDLTCSTVGLCIGSLLALRFMKKRTAIA